MRQIFLDIGADFGERLILIKNEYETLEWIREERKSLARYGDGEFKLCKGKNQISQPPGEAIGKRLRGILKSDDENLLVGIPNIFNKESFLRMPEDKQHFWKSYCGDKTVNLLQLDKQYVSSFVTRVDSAPGINTVAYWHAWMSVWSGKRVLLVKGARCGFNKANPLETAAEVFTWIGPDIDAFSKYDEILKQVVAEVKEKEIDLVVLSLGPTATILAADLSSIGIWALDLGHFGQSFARWKWALLKEAESPSILRRYSIFESGKDGVRPNKPGSSRTICDVHLRLANVIDSGYLSLKPEDRVALLEYVDEIYDMGKRMGEKLRDYHREFVKLGIKQGAWREGF